VSNHGPHDPAAGTVRSGESSATQFALDSKAEAAIREAAKEALRASFAALTKEHVLPRSEHRPWIWMARDYFGYAVEGEKGALSKALEAGLPGRFSIRGIDSVDYPSSYAAAVLEAAVAAATRNHEPYDVSSPSVQRAIDELVDKVQATPRSTVLRVVTDIDVEHEPTREGYQAPLGETIEVAGVRVIRVENQPERFIEQEIPSAGYEVDRSQVVVFPGPASLLVSTVGAVSGHGQRAEEARRRVDHLVSSVRLATGSTVHAVIDIEGDPDPVHWVSPTITPLPSWGFRFLHRPVTLTAGHVPGLSRLVSFLGSWNASDDWIPLRIALGRLNRSLDGRTPGIVDQVIDLSIGLEAALAGTERTEIGLRLRTRAAGILATEVDPPDAIYRHVKVLYELRSAFVHGGRLQGRAVDKAIKSVSGDGGTPAEQYLGALDRWRDLLRRAILARIALMTADATWPAHNAHKQHLDVDQLLLRDRDRESWRRQIRGFWEWQGLPEAHNLPSAPRRMLRDVSSRVKAADR